MELSDWIYTPNNALLEGCVEGDAVTFDTCKVKIPNVGMLEDKRKQFILVGRTPDFERVGHIARPDGVSGFQFPEFTHRSLWLDDGRVFMNPAYVHDADYNSLLNKMIPHIGQILAFEQYVAKHHKSQKVYHFFTGNWYFPGATSCVPEFKYSTSNEFQQGSDQNR